MKIKMEIKCNSERRSITQLAPFQYSNCGFKSYNHEMSMTPTTAWNLTLQSNAEWRHNYSCHYWSCLSERQRSRVFNGLKGFQDKRIVGNDELDEACPEKLCIPTIEEFTGYKYPTKNKNQWVLGSTRDYKKSRIGPLDRPVFVSQEPLTELIFHY